jgi:ABC-type xylose transport system permease subunit
MEVLRNEPALIGGLVTAILGLLLAFGVDLSNEQVGSIMAVTGVIIAILVRLFVTPTNKLPEVEPPPVVDSM